MTEIRLYYGVVGVENFVAQLLQNRLLATGQQVVIYTASKEAASVLDDQLWSLPSADSFIPHCLTGDPHANRTPVVLTYPGDPQAKVRDVLINLLPVLPTAAVSYLHFITVLGARNRDHAGYIAALEQLASRGHKLRQFDLAKRRAT